MRLPSAYGFVLGAAVKNNNFIAAVINNNLIAAVINNNFIAAPYCPYFVWG